MTDNSKPPKIENAPGLTWRPTKDGWLARWRPRPDLVKRGCPVKILPLWQGSELTDADRHFIADQCRALQDRMLAWGRGGDTVSVIYDGSISALVACYQSDPDSRFKKLRYKSRENYSSLLRRIEKDHGDEFVRDIRARHLLRWHEEWTGSGTAMAHGLVGMLSTLATFGATLLECEDCRALKITMHDMRFPMPKPRGERLTAEQANAVRAKAHEMGLHSIARAQAFQFECMLRQKDVIGEWVPSSEPGVSDVHSGGDDGYEKWLRGLRWEEIDENLILRHTTSKRGKDIEVNLKLAPMVMEELAFMGERPTKGPIIVSERTGVPWQSYEFRRKWREVATAVDIPKSVYNMDTRAGAISEATDAGADLESVRHAATHSDIAMTQRYSRGPAEKIAGVMQKRVAHRNKNGTSGT